MVLRGSGVPDTISPRQKLGWQILGLFALSCTLIVTCGMAVVISLALGEVLPGIFGRATGAIILGLICWLFVRTPLAHLLQWLKVRHLSQQELFSPLENSQMPTNSSRPTLRQNLAKFGHSLLRWLRRWGIYLVITLLVCIIPYPYRPGGSIELLPPQQVQIQAEVNGKIIQVMYPGGDGQLIQAKTVVALMEATDLENQIATLKKSIAAAQENTAKEQANLNKLINTPRPEDVAVAQADLNQAIEELKASQDELRTVQEELQLAKKNLAVTQNDVAVAQQELETAKINVEYNQGEALRYKELWQAGAIKFQQYQDAEKATEQARSNVTKISKDIQGKILQVAQSRQTVQVKTQEVAKQKQNIQVSRRYVEEKQANLDLILSGTHPDDIKAARSNVKEAQAEVERLQQQLKYNQDQQRRTALVMPTTGRIVTPYLQNMVGKYLKQGEVFSIVEDDSHMFGELRLPE
jgi:multidrug resistance efflux pump